MTRSLLQVNSGDIIRGPARVHIWDPTPESIIEEQSPWVDLGEGEITTDPWESDEPFGWRVEHRMSSPSGFRASWCGLTTFPSTDPPGCPPVANNELLSGKWDICRTCGRITCSDCLAELRRWVEAGRPLPWPPQEPRRRWWRRPR